MAAWAIISLILIGMGMLVLWTRRDIRYIRGTASIISIASIGIVLISLLSVIGKPAWLLLYGTGEHEILWMHLEVDEAIYITLDVEDGIRTFYLDWDDKLAKKLTDAYDGAEQEGDLPPALVVQSDDTLIGLEVDIIPRKRPIDLKRGPSRL